MLLLCILYPSCGSGPRPSGKCIPFLFTFSTTFLLSYQCELLSCQHEFLFEFLDSYARWAFEALCINAFSGDTTISNGKNGDGYFSYLGFMHFVNKYGSTKAKLIAFGIFAAIWAFFHILANASFSYARRQVRTWMRKKGLSLGTSHIFKGSAEKPGFLSCCWSAGVRAFIREKSAQKELREGGLLQWKGTLLLCLLSIEHCAMCALRLISVFLLAAVANRGQRQRAQESRIHHPPWPHGQGLRGLNTRFGYC